MINTAIKIFNRVYQSYLTGGDTYTYYFKTDDDREIQEIIDSIKELENMGLVDLMHYNNKKARMCITSDGISYGNDNFWLNKSTCSHFGTGALIYYGNKI